MEGTYGKELLRARRIDVVQLVAEVEKGPPFYGKHPWVPAVESLEMVGVAPTMSIVRLIMFPIRAALRKIDGRNAGLLVAIRSESERQCVRTGHEKVHTMHVLMAVASLSHQLSLVGMEEPPQMRGVAGMLADSGISYLTLSRCLSKNSVSRLHEGRLGLEEGSVPESPQMSNEAERFFDAVKPVLNEADGYVRMVERVLREGEVQGIIRECRAATGGEVDG